MHGTRHSVGGQACRRCLSPDPSHRQGCTTCRPGTQRGFHEQTRALWGCRKRERRRERETQRVRERERERERESWRARVQRVSQTDITYRYLFRKSSRGCQRPILLCWRLPGACWARGKPATGILYAPLLLQVTRDLLYAPSRSTERGVKVVSSACTRSRVASDSGSFILPT